MLVSASEELKVNNEKLIVKSEKVLEKKKGCEQYVRSLSF